MMNNYSIIKRLYTDYTSKYVRKIIIAIFFSFFVAGSTSGIAYLLDPAIKKIFVERDNTLLYIIPGLIILAFATKGISLYIAKVIMIGVAEDVKTDLQKDMMKALISADTKFIDSSHSGKFISKLTTDVGMITMLISTAILNLFKDTMTLAGLLFVMFYQNWKLSMIAIIMIPLASFSVKILGKRISKTSSEMMQSAGFFTTHLLEVFKNHKLIKTFQAEKHENLRSKDKLDELKTKAKKMTIVFHRSTPIMEVLTGIMIASLIFYSGKLIESEELEINNFFSFLAAMMMAYQPVRSLAGLTLGISQGVSAAKRILPVVDLENDIKANPQLPSLDINEANIKFENVTFKYESKENAVLKSTNLDINGGKMTALVGLSGAGKTTILNLIPRFYDCDSGDILIDNQSIYNSNLNSLRRNISIVSQETTLFDDTIKNNILYAKLDASEEEILLAAKNSFADEFIQKLPYKYETIIGENGVRLSGGEKQRLSIARAMLKKSSIILLDEATSSLDSDTENKIQNAISFLTKNKTTVVIAHRLSTILNANKIYVINAGEIVDNGTHKELLVSSDIYKNFYEKQLKNN
jgi:ATP-binding cassette, subfamily B, bacterial MsbA